MSSAQRAAIVCITDAEAKAKMVSADQFREELRARMSRAEAHGATDILIHGGELCRSVPAAVVDSGSLRVTIASMEICSKAMQEELRPGDIVLVEADAGVRMKVRYLLPRKEEWALGGMPSSRTLARVVPDDQVRAGVVRQTVPPSANR